VKNKMVDFSINLMIDFVPPIEPPIPERSPSPPRIALWHWADDCSETYLLNAIIWRTEMRRKYPEQYSWSEKEIAAPDWLSRSRVIGEVEGTGGDGTMNVAGPTTTVKDRG
jgi:hypothetical protein